MPERLIKEPWRLALFFVAVFGMMILCTGVLVYEQEAGNRHRADSDAQIRHIQNLELIAIQKVDRNNQTGWKAVKQAAKSYEAGQEARQQLIAMVANEERMNRQLLTMNKQEIRYQKALLKELTRRRR